MKIVFPYSLLRTSKYRVAGIGFWAPGLFGLSDCSLKFEVSGQGFRIKLHDCFWGTKHFPVDEHGT